jgi:hypothetical protein
MHRLLRYLLAFGTIGYALASYARSQRFAELSGLDEEAVQQMSVRDLGSGVELLIADNPAPALATRVIYDLSDGLTLMRTKRTVAPVAFIWGALAIAAILTRTGGEEED